jgi:hypothetical protein
MKLININLVKEEMTAKQYCWKEVENYSIVFEDRLQSAELLYSWLTGLYDPLTQKLTDSDTPFSND